MGNTAEAMAASLIIAGLEDHAQVILEHFSWGEEFVRLNRDVFDLYASADDAIGVKAKEAEFLRRCAEEAAQRRSAAIDLPSSGSEESEESDDDEKRDDA